MTTRSTPLYLGDELRAQAERAAEVAGRSLSAWVREAIEARLGHEAKIAAGLEAVCEFERDCGLIPPEVEAVARRELENAGVIPPTQRVSVTYDAGALIAVDRDDPLMFARHRQAVSRGVVPVVPAPVIWQVWRDGSRQARLARFLKGCWVEPVDDDVARDAGVLLGRTGTIDGVDAAVVLSAQRRGGVVYTSDPDDLGLLAGYLGKARFVIYRV